MNRPKKFLYLILFLGIYSSIFAQGKLDSVVPNTLSIDGKALTKDY